ncbi:MAG: urea carboxylase-associated family protein [Pseudomonadota bacterium]
MSVPHPLRRSVSRIAPQSGQGFRMKRGEILRVIDPQGEQVSDLFAFAADNPNCALSSGRSIDYASKIYFTTGDVLWSNDSRPMFTILRDDVRRHDFLLTPCSQRMFEILYQHSGHHPSCFENLARAFEPFGIGPERISTTFNIFMRVDVSAEGVVEVKAPMSRAGDVIELRAEMDLICGLTACSAEGSNNGTFKPVDWEVVAQ